MSESKSQDSTLPSYFLPVNSAEAERLLSQHHVLIDALSGRMILPPLDLRKPGLKILDSGTADGHWINELRKSLPDPTIHTYIGTDINPTLFPQILPADTTFQIQNIANEWPSNLHSTFDLIHQRLTLPGAAPTALPLAIHHLFQCLKPGGWIQLIEAEQIGPEAGPVFSEFLDLVRALFDATGAGWHYAEKIKGWLEDEGAIHVQECVVDMGFGARNKDEGLGGMSARCTAGAMEGLVRHAKLATNLKTNLSIEQMDTLGSRLFDELVEIGAYYRIRCVWGRKKLEDEAYGGR